MAYMIDTWKHVMRPWGNEVRFTATDNETGRIYNEVIRISEKADEKEVISAITTRLDKLTSQASVLEPEITFTKSEVEAMLRDKGYLTEEEDLDDLKAKD